MAEPPAKKKRVHVFQDAWKKGRQWLVYNPQTKEMSCSICQAFFKGKLTGYSGFGRDAWLKGCGRLKQEVVVEHDASKMHRDAYAAEKTRMGVA